MIIHEGAIVGISFEPHKNNFKNFLSKSDKKLAQFYLTLKRDEDNEFDLNAIQVLAHLDGQSYALGHIPKSVNVKLIKLGLENLAVEPVRINVAPDGAEVGLTIRVLKL